jgi:hypothetical protein
MAKITIQAGPVNALADRYASPEPGRFRNIPPLEHKKARLTKN